MKLRVTISKYHHKSCHYLYKYRIKFLYVSALQSFLFTFRKNAALWVKYQEEIMPLRWSILKVIFKTDLSYLLSLVFVSLSLVFDHVLFSCFDLLFSLVLEFMLSSRIYYIHRYSIEQTCCNISDKIFNSALLVS